MCDSKCKESVLDGCQEQEVEGEVDDLSDRVCEDNVSIQQILQEMTNEFNKGVSPKQSSEMDCPNGQELPSPENFEVSFKDDGKVAKAVKLAKIQGTFVNSAGKLLKDSSDKSDQESNETLNTNETIEVKENQDAKEASKKDSNIPRIVLTFRTIDENTDSGKKTKISSCSSNLTLVPDDLVNCNQIGGVSVKIETSEEYLDFADRSDTEEGNIENEKKEIEDIEKNFDNEKGEIEDNDDGTQSELLYSDEVPLVDKIDKSRKSNVSLSKPVAENELETNSTFIKKRRKRSLRVIRYVILMTIIFIILY